MAECSVGKLDFNKPAIRAESFEDPSSDGGDFTGEETSRIDQVARVREDKIATLIRLRIPTGFASGVADEGDRLEIVGHGVTIDRVPVPGSEGEQTPDLVSDKSFGKTDTGIETAIVTDLENQRGVPKQ